MPDDRLRTWRSILRIIAGTHRGRILATPKGMDTRPTRGRVRESLFSILQSRLPGAYALDLFAGSGALGLEALSRGAREVVFVDCDGHAQAAIESNVRAFGFGERARLLRCDCFGAISRLSRETPQFDLLFLDPPYRMESKALLSAIQSSGICKPTALWIYEHAKDQAETPDGLIVADERKYGDTVITFYQADRETP